MFNKFARTVVTPACGAGEIFIIKNGISLFRGFFHVLSRAFLYHRGGIILAIVPDYAEFAFRSCINFTSGTMYACKIID